MRKIKSLGLYLGCCLVALSFSTISSSAEDLPINERLLKRDFMRVVMSAEYGGNTKFGKSVKKYVNRVRFAIINHAAKDRRLQVRDFVWSLQSKINGLETALVSDRRKANFRIHVVDSYQYATVIKHHIYKNTHAKVRGRCFVRVMPGQIGIGQSDVVIVSDHDEATFRRCLVEEILQGLGPLADRGHRKYSVFNTASKHTTFTSHDQVLMNALYDPRVKAGMSKSEVAKILPAVISDAVRLIRDSKT